MGSANSRGSKGVVTPKVILAGIAVLVALLIIALVLVIYLTVQNNKESERILTSSVKTELIASSIAARTIVTDNLDFFISLNSQEDIDENWDEWLTVVGLLTDLNEEIGGEYIYVLKEIDGEFYFVFDTDPEVQINRDVMTPYELAPVHLEAFDGIPSADVMNVADEWGSYNTGAVPLLDRNDEVIGVVATDIADTYMHQFRDSSAFYTTALIVTISASVAMMLIVLIMLIRRNSKMQTHLFTMANFDPISGLPNRNNLFSFLASKTKKFIHDKRCYAVLFIDLDNFKSVNDEAGHDIGDVLLKQIASFLSNHAEEFSSDTSSFMDPLTARIGGDEFLQLIPSLSTPEEASVYAKSLLEAFRKEPELQSFIDLYAVGLSVGVSLFPSMNTNYDELIKFADIAMYYAKSHGKNSFRVYDASMGDDVEDAELSVRTNRGTR